jgi:hypothetical protein
MIGSYCGTGGTVSTDLWSDVELALRTGPAGMIQLPSRDGLPDDAADSTVSDESRELVRREGNSTLVGDNRSDSGSSVRVFERESRDSLEGVLGGRLSRASCSSNWAIGEGETSGDDGSTCIRVARVYAVQEA